MAPVPEQASSRTSFFVPTKSFSCAEHPLVEGAELGRAVVNVRRGHGELGGGQQRSRTGSEQASLTNHDDESLRTILAPQLRLC